MSSNEEINDQDPNVIALRAERDLNSQGAKVGKNEGDSVRESGVDEAAAEKFPGGQVTYGSAASGAGDNREITDEEGGGINPNTGRQTKAGDFEGVGGPEDQKILAENTRGGDQDVQGNVRQGGGDVKQNNPPGSDGNQ